MDEQILTFVFLSVGFILLFVELFIPSGGTIGVMCVASFLASVYFAYQAWAESYPLYWRIYLTTFLTMIPVTLYGIYYLITKTPFGNRVLLAAPTMEEVTPYQEEHHHLEGLVGRRGVAISPLTPGGLVQVGHDRLHAVGEGFSIERGADVEVIAIRGNRIVVRTASTLVAEMNEKSDHSADSSPLPDASPSSLDPFADESSQG